MQFVAQGDSGHAIVMDAAESAGGHDTAARPMEVLLMGLSGCTALDVISILRKKRQPVQGFKIFATGERAEERPHAYTKIHLEYVAFGDVDPEALARSIQLSEEKYCGAIATVRGVAEITSSYRVEKTA
ncbi:MAG: osmotically inducible protein OsmC [Chloroflexi bacterium HGW-Chloroflexi-1]|nr:MAG: osmotically inducible protein OsmC [Chloroflexi bacterium HGW-Chloroflexi-1]